MYPTLYSVFHISVVYDIGTFFCERLAYFGIASNLVTYLTTRLHEGPVSAARNVTTFQGTCYLTPLIGSFFADAYWGRYWTIAVFYGVYLIVNSTETMIVLYYQLSALCLCLFILSLLLGGN